ncbi:glycosyltransferase [Orrella daihaiensis]|uniref:Glycosyltransferase n=1 Tax=Orrella daihaiensis TaxID=2782176 RepID=A0ABY4APW0_9BURK|nr:glycosyltransferase [Orrella daihaiensis]UOD51425.1 glycosyltransferase [Orrella daihaiensis]
MNSKNIENKNGINVKKIYKSFQHSINSNDLKEAAGYGRLILESDYPNSLKRYVEQKLKQTPQLAFLEKESDITRRFIREVSSKSTGDLSDYWLPWRILGDYWGIEPTKKNKGIILKKYESYLREGFNYIDILPLKKEITRKFIRPYFDGSHYCCVHEDIGAGKTDPFLHYINFGLNEPNREPNSLFKNDIFWSIYPWTKIPGLNPLYLFTRWPEQFPIMMDVISANYSINLTLGCENKLKRKAKYDDVPASKKYVPNNNDRLLCLIREYSARSCRKQTNVGKPVIHFVVPDFTKGGGGHMTIFRLIKHLEKYDFSCVIWIKDFDPSRHPLGPKNSISSNYQVLNSCVRPLDGHYAFAFGDAVVATSWDTVDFVALHNGFHEKFYLVQDFEPYFYPKGANSLKAEFTYKKSLKTICAGSWLDNLMRTKYGRTSVCFPLSYDPEYYFPCHTVAEQADHNENNTEESISSHSKIFRIAVYARARTDRRAVALAMEGLSLLKSDDYQICLELFGDIEGSVSVPTSIVAFDNGILSSKELGELYRSCDLGVTFSTTNYALVPQEMMACKLPVVEIDSESTRAIYPPEVVSFVAPDPIEIAKEIQKLLSDPKKRSIQATNAYRWVSATNWDKSFEIVRNFISEELGKSANQKNFKTTTTEFYLNQSYRIISRQRNACPAVTVVIPTLNGGKLLQLVVSKVLSQNIMGPLELIIIDSGSSDGSIQWCQEHFDFTLVSIRKDDFQHGRTRNLGVALAKSEYVAFLTQDALPVSPDWLKYLVAPFERNKNIAGCFGRHEAYPEHSAHLKRSLNLHFDKLKSNSNVKIAGIEKYFYSCDISIRQAMHFFSDNNSALRKSIWEKIPYPDVQFGEDQFWADEILIQGFEKVYVDRALVFHSHDFDEVGEYERAKTESFYFFKYFGYRLDLDRPSIECSIQSRVIEELAKSDEPANLVDERKVLKLFRATLEGHSAGVRMFKELSGWGH